MTISKHLESAIDILYRAGQDDNEKARSERRIAKALAAEAALPDLLAAFRASAGEFARLAGMLQEGNPLFGKILRDAATAAYSAIAKAEGGGG